MACTHLYTPGWGQTKWSKVPCLRKQHDGRGLNPRPPDPEFQMLTARPHTSSSKKVSPYLKQALKLNFSFWISQNIDNFLTCFATSISNTNYLNGISTSASLVMIPSVGLSWMVFMYTKAFLVAIIFVPQDVRLVSNRKWVPLSLGRQLGSLSRRSVLPIIPMKNLLCRTTRINIFPHDIAKFSLMTWKKKDAINSKKF